MGDDIPTLQLHFDDTVIIKPEDVLDWMIVEAGKLISNYTIRLAYQRISLKKNKNF